MKRSVFASNKSYDTDFQVDWQTFVCLFVCFSARIMVLATSLWLTVLYVEKCQFLKINIIAEKSSTYISIESSGAAVYTKQRH